METHLARSQPEATRDLARELLEGLRRMRARGMERECVSATGTNTPAVRLYESVAFKVLNRYLDYVKMA